MNIFVVIPSYNSEATLADVLADVQQNIQAQIVVVDDGSQDATAYVAQTAGVVVLRHEINLGQGAALQTGNEYALQHQADIIVHFDADGQMRGKDIPILVQPIQNKTTEVVLGSRYLSQKNNVPWLKQYIYFPIGRIVNMVFTGLWLSDAHCGFRALSAKAARLITIRQNRMAHATEILEKISQHAISFVEVPVVIKYTDFGQGLRGINGAVQTVKDLVKAKLLR